MDISAGLNEYRLQGVINFLALGAANAHADIYAGTQPAFGGTPTGGPLVSIDLVEPLGAISAGLLNITATPESMITNSGTATWARVVNGDGSIAWDCPVTDLAGDGPLKLSATVLYAGGYTRIVSGVLG